MVEYLISEFLLPDPGILNVVRRNKRIREMYGEKDSMICLGQGLRAERESVRLSRVARSQHRKAIERSNRAHT